MAETQNDAQAPVAGTPGARLAQKRAARAAKKAAARGKVDPTQQVASAVMRVNTWLDDNSKTIWLALLAVIALGVGGVALSEQLGKSSHEAGALLYAAVHASQGTIAKDEPSEDPDAKPLYPAFRSAEERDKKALASFAAVGKRAQGSPAGAWAKLGEANLLLATGKNAEAARAYEAAQQRAGEDTFLRARALEGRGYALSAQQKHGEAIKQFEALARLDGGAFAALGNYHRARALVASGKRDEARKVLEALLAEAAKPPPKDATEPRPKQGSVLDAAELLLQELGGKPAPRTPSGEGGLSPQLLEALRQQLSDKQGSQ